MAALRACEKRGVRMFAATGRPPNVEAQLSLPPEAAAFVRDGVFLNGARVRLDGWEDLRFLGGREARDIVGIAWDDPEVNIALQLADGRHVFRRPIAESEWGHWGLRGEGDVLAMGSERDVPAEVLKIILFERSDGELGGKALHGLFDRLSRSAPGSCRAYLSDGGTVIQAMSGSASKKDGVETVIRRLGLRADQIAVFGDDANDREMLAAYPHSVAMGNAPPEVAALARWRTKGNDEEGIALALSEILRLAPSP